MSQNFTLKYKISYNFKTTVLWITLYKALYMVYSCYCTSKG